MSTLSPAVAAQIESIRIDSQQPLLLCDADEVLLQFLRGLEGHLSSEGYLLDLVSFSLFGNIKHADTGTPAAREDVAKLIRGFFVEKMHTLQPVAGAAEALAGLAPEVQIVVLTNTPPLQRAARAAILANHGMPYPVLANEGLKGAAAKALAAQTSGPVLFMDDIPHNIDSVLEHAEGSQAIHFVADERLRPLIPKAPAALHRVDEWHLAEPLIRKALLG